jgi:hypothetical protein
LINLSSGKQLGQHPVANPDGQEPLSDLFS